MKPALAIALVILVFTGALAGIYVYRAFVNSPTSPTCSNGATAYPACGNTSNCSDPANISSHIYNPYRLVIVKPCVTVSGTVDRTITEDDGDIHLRLKLDPANQSLVNSANDQYQYGFLVVEIICAKTVTQADAVPACSGYTNQIPIPRAGDHITVKGPYVTDSDHHGWAEIHPVYSLVIG